MEMMFAEAASVLHKKLLTGIVFLQMKERQFGKD
jgi:hypothetical protein